MYNNLKVSDKLSAAEDMALIDASIPVTPVVPDIAVSVDVKPSCLETSCGMLLPFPRGLVEVTASFDTQIVLLI